jgi:hypothetical protein
VFLRCGKTGDRAAKSQFKEKSPDFHNRADTTSI